MPTFEVRIKVVTVKTYRMEAESDYATEDYFGDASNWDVQKPVKEEMTSWDGPFVREVTHG